MPMSPAGGRAVSFSLFTNATHWFLKTLNPKIRGWVNYYTKFARSEGLEVYNHLNKQIGKWLAAKYRIKCRRELLKKYNSILEETPKLFYHWQLGMKRLG
jgi:hypothetical protein